MREALRNRPLAAALLVFAVYALSFVVPILLRGGASSGFATLPPVEQARHDLPLQLWLAALLSGATAVLGWRHGVGFRRLEPRGGWFIAVAFLPVGAIALLGLLLAVGAGGFFPGVAAGGVLLLVLFYALVGYTEELMFRGVLLHGLAAGGRPLVAPVLCGVLFGLLHLVNLFAGQSPGQTVAQVVQAGSEGFAWAAVRLRAGAIVPLMVLHGLFDLLLTGNAAALQALRGPGAAALVPGGDGGLSPTVIAPALLYGAFVLVMTARYFRAHPDRKAVALAP